MATRENYLPPFDPVPPKKIEGLRYYDIQANWRRIRHLFYDEDNLHQLYHKMECYSEVRAEEHKYEYRPKEFSASLRPWHYDSCDWRFIRDTGKTGRKPAFWDFACHSACHWVNSWAHLCICGHTKATEGWWRIVTSDKHTTVWDGEKTLFDINFSAIGVPVEEAWELAACQPDSAVWGWDEFMTHKTPNAIKTPTGWLYG